MFRCTVYGLTLFATLVKKTHFIDVIPINSSQRDKNRAQYTQMRTTSTDNRIKHFLFLIEVLWHIPLIFANASPCRED
jgi:hypothetical protein